MFKIPTPDDAEALVPQLRRRISELEEEKLLLKATILEQAKMIESLKNSQNEYVDAPKSTNSLVKPSRKRNYPQLESSKQEAKRTTVEKLFDAEENRNKNSVAMQQNIAHYKSQQDPQNREVKENSIETVDLDAKIIKDEPALFTYPPQEKVREMPFFEPLNVSVHDAAYLQWGQMLNDIIIMYMMTNLTIKYLPDPLWKQIWFANTFCFSNWVNDKGTLMWFDERTLETGNRRENVYNLEMLDRNLMNTDLKLKAASFTNKKVIVIPINQEEHWMLAIIVNPVNLITNSNGPRTDNRKCHILILDSLNNSKTSKRNTHVKFVVETWIYRLFDTRKETIQIDMDRLQCTIVENLPKQNNGVDCGVFLLHYLVSMFTSEGFFDRDFDYLDWQECFPNGMNVNTFSLRSFFFSCILKNCDPDGRRRLIQDGRFAELFAMSNNF